MVSDRCPQDRADVHAEAVSELEKDLQARRAELPARSAGGRCALRGRGRRRPGSGRAAGDDDAEAPRLSAPARSPSSDAGRCNTAGASRGGVTSDRRATSCRSSGGAGRGRWPQRGSRRRSTSCRGEHSKLPCLLSYSSASGTPMSRPVRHGSGRRGTRPQATRLFGQVYVGPGSPNKRRSGTVQPAG